MRYFLVFFFGFIASVLTAQQPLPLNSPFMRHAGRRAYSSGEHLLWWSGHYAADMMIDSAARPRASWLGRKAFEESLLHYDTGRFRLEANPLFDLAAGKGRSDSLPLFRYNRGVQLSGSYGQTLSFSSRFTENLARFPDYVAFYPAYRKVVPGQGYVRKASDGRFDYASSAALLRWTPLPVFEVEAGYGKHIVGEGYRSMFLSDNAFQYPYLKLRATVGFLQYTALYASLLNLHIPKLSYTHGLPKKYAVFHHLSFKVGQRGEFGLFEGVLWQAADSSGWRGFDWHYAHPLLFLRPVEFSLGSPDNALLGVQGHWRFGRATVAYGQFLLDDYYFARMKEGKGFFQNKFAWQFGLKAYDLLGVSGLYAWAEYNAARPYTYAHKQAEQSYTHYYQPLAHPLGANFSELNVGAEYVHRRFFASAMAFYAIQGRDSSGSHWGSNIFLSDFQSTTGIYSFGNTIGQGVSTSILYGRFEAGWCLNRKTLLSGYLGLVFRRETIAGSRAENLIIEAGIRTSLLGQAFDF